ncbi:BTB/POZ domain and ankyrin repeat-containing protein NPR1-like [Amaranthus tricolor]|uniref:BTB/POZ domain and ankyrin repeat-containing protein NPR1-like n=1 Tax=Amaranthus tricolor TaxID=29722 RepID=UPI0025911B0C|nr:BTB/POZ domain and ankyrin repeat-containing protein NPR1-like [Amaranthus tricolor]
MTIVMDSRTVFSDSNDISNGSSICCVATNTTPTAAENCLTAKPESEALNRLSENLETLFQPSLSESDSFADAKIIISGDSREIFIHRCILSSRSSFFRAEFASKRDKEKQKDKETEKLVRLELKDMAGDVEVRFDSLVAVLRYLYSGKVRPNPKEVCMCVDDDCSHIACRPTVEFLVEVLYLSHKFKIDELVALYQRHLMDILEKVSADDILVVLSVAEVCESVCKSLQDRCIDIIVKIDVDVTTLDKFLAHHTVKQIIDTRKELGLTEPAYVEFPDKHVKRIHRALESDDVELVRMLLKEGHTSLDGAFALHYAVAYCDAKTTTELLELGLADVNLRNVRGYTVLHIAAMRKEPKIIVSLLTKGAHASATTPDGRKAVQIAKRLTKHVDFYRPTEQGKASPKDRLCIEILEQAERREPLLGEGSVSLAKAGDDLRMKLLYLENRVALARLLFPIEAKVAMDIAQVDGTSEFTLSKNIANARRNAVDLNEAPFMLKEEHLQRMKALSRTVELGKRFFPRCSEVLNQIMDAEDLSQLAFLGKDTPEERQRKKQKYQELQDALTKAFSEDKEEFERSTLSSSSSTAFGRPYGKTHLKR